MAAWVLSIPRQDDASFVLVNVSPTKDGSSRALDLGLIGTEGAAPYVLKLRQSRVFSLKAKSSQCNEDEWQTILESVLLGKSPDEAEELLRGVQAVAAVQEEKAINITIRKQIEGITQRLGSFQLAYEEKQEIELFDWCVTAIKSSSTSKNELASLKFKFRQQEDTISKLTTKLEDLTKAKTDHEAELIEKFRFIINEKKSKIRNQSRLLAFSNFDPHKLAANEASGRGHSAGESRMGKRKEATSDDSEDDAFEEMDVDEDRASIESDAREALTPEPSDDDEEVESAALSPAYKTRTVTARTVEAKQMSTGPTKDVNDREATPPRRELPFGNKSALPKKTSPVAKTRPAQPVAEDEEETESDDEL